MASSSSSESSSAPPRQPLFNTIAEGGPLSDLAAASVLQALLDYAERRDTYVPLLPEHVLLTESGAIEIVEDSGTAGTSQGSVFVAPESVKETAYSASAAYAWNLGIFLYVLLSGYQPFASSTTDCPFYTEFFTSKQLTCPPHFSRQVIALLCGMIVVLPEYRMSIPDIRAECMTWMMLMLQPPSSQGVADGGINIAPAPRGAKHPVRKRLKEQGIGGKSTLDRLDALGQLSVHGSDRTVLSGEAATGAAAAAAAGATGGLTLSLSCVDDNMAADSERRPPEDTPSPEPAQRGGDGPSTAAAWERRGEMPPPPPPQSRVAVWQGEVVGPHGKAHGSVRKGLCDHPNSPMTMSRQLQHLEGPLAQRPIAVIYSPDSSLPRKVSNDVAAAWSAPRAPRQTIRRPQFKRLGWDVRAAGPDGLLSRITSVLTELDIQFESPASTEQPLSVMTKPCVVSDAMGFGQMQAMISLAETSACDAPGSGSYRIDVARHSGDTFQFHAFYRQLRSGLKEIIEGSATQPAGGTTSPPPEPAAPGADAGARLPMATN